MAGAGGARARTFVNLPKLSIPMNIYLKMSPKEFDIPGAGNLLQVNGSRALLKDGMRLKAFIALASALAWTVSVLLHERFLPALSYAPGIDYVYFPSGIRFIAILVGGVWAAVGVSIGSVVLWGAEFGLTTWAPVLVLSLCSGFAPYLALRATLAVLGVNDDLGNLRPSHLPLISLGGALGSSLLHNLVFCALGLQPWGSFGIHLLALTMGDFAGIFLAVVAVFVVLRIYRRRLP